MKKLPVQEMYYLPVRDYSYEISHAKRERTCQILLALLLITFIIAFIADNFLGMTVAHAETPHDDRYYCQQYRDGDITVIGATSLQMDSYCNSL